ncbi:MAG: alpha/beta hydrolase family protein [Paracoccaceae bacterium]
MKLGEQITAGQTALQFRAGHATLKGTLFAPDHPPKAAIVLHGAVGVPAGYYRAFAEWLRDQGYACLTYDYRDFAASRTVPLRQSKADLQTWGLTDQPAALAELRRLMPHTPHWVIGHSLGGTMLGFHAMEGVARVITVASGMVTLSDHPFPYRALAAWFWYGLPRAANAVMGYLPGRALRMGPDLPAGVYRQWRRWCTRPGFWQGDVGTTLPSPDPSRITCPMKIVAVADDAVVPAAAVWRIMALYPKAIKRQLTLRPADFGRPAIGHIAAFSRTNREIWPAIIS